MPTYQRGSFSIKLKFEPLDGEFAECDRQLAWKAYLQIANCQAVRTYESRDGTALLELENMPRSFEDVRLLSRQLLEIAQQYPMGKPSPNRDDFGTFLAQVLEVALNPFIYTWEFHDQRNCGQPLPAAGGVDSGAGNQHAEELSNDWTSLRSFFRDVMGELVQKHGFVNLESMLPKHVRVTWREQAARIISGSDIA